MPAKAPSRKVVRSQVNRRDFLKHAGLGTVGMTALVAGARRARAATSPYPDWIPASTKPPKRGGVLTPASSWDPPVSAPRLTQSGRLFQVAGLTSSRLARYAFPYQASSTYHLCLNV